MTLGWHSVVTWALILGGWYAVHLATLSRERRKERRDASKASIEAISALAAEAREFHIAVDFDANRADLLRYKTERLIRSLQRPPLQYLDISVAKMVKLRKSITLKNAELSSFSSQRADSLILQEIRTATDDLIDSIEEEREARWE